jgi:phosphoglycerate dehydrogenase-like enzyme
MNDTEARVALITFPIDEQWQKRLQDQVQTSKGLQIVVQPARKVADIPADVWQRTEALLTLRALPTLEQAPNLRWVQLYSAGVNQILKQPLYQEKQVTFTTASGVHAVNIAEYVFTMLLAWYHRLPLILQNQQKKQWKGDEEGMRTLQIEELRGKTIGIVGYGSIGREVARMAKTFGMRVLALQRSEDHSDHGFLFPDIGDPDGTIPERYYDGSQLHDMLRESDVVVIGIPLTPQTTHLFNADAFDAMKSTAFLVNIARGEVCDQEALIHALQEQRIAGAALDVTDPEPLPADNPLWGLPNVFISPHISGLTPHYEERVLTIFIENLRRYLAGAPLYNMVDKEQQY